MMRKFRFATLLRVRELQEELKAQELGKVQRELALARQEREHLVAEQQRMLEEAARKTRDVFDAAPVVQYFYHERFLSRRLDELDARIAQLRELEEARRQEVAEASKAKRVVQRLREKHQKAMQMEINKIEQMLADEVAVSRVSMRRRTGMDIP